MKRRRSRPKRSPIHLAMTAARARQIVAHGYLHTVCPESLAEWHEIREALKAPDLFARPGKEKGDTWGFYGACDDDCAPVTVAAAELDAFVNDRRKLQRALDRKKWEEIDRDALGATHRTVQLVDRACPCGRVHVSSHAHESIAGPLEALPAKHDLLGPLMRADDARSGVMCLIRWAHALAYHWGVDSKAFWRAISAHPSSSW